MSLFFLLFLLLPFPSVNEDYVSFSTDLTFLPLNGDPQTRCHDVNIISDQVYEGEETFIISMTTSDPNATIGRSSTKIIIKDNDGMYLKWGDI